MNRFLDQQTKEAMISALNRARSDIGLRPSEMWKLILLEQDLFIGTLVARYLYDFESPNRCAFSQIWVASTKTAELYSNEAIEIRFPKIDLAKARLKDGSTAYYGLRLAFSGNPKSDKNASTLTIGASSAEQAKGATPVEEEILTTKVAMVQDLLPGEYTQIKPNAFVLADGTEIDRSYAE